MLKHKKKYNCRGKFIDARYKDMFNQPCISCLKIENKADDLKQLVLSELEMKCLEQR